MALPVTLDVHPDTALPVDGSGYRSALTLLATVVFMCGLITVVDSALLSVWFVACFFAWILSTKLIERIGYERWPDGGLAIVAVAALGRSRRHRCHPAASRWSLRS